MSDKEKAPFNDDVIHVGLDLGTFNSAIVTNQDKRYDVISLIGWPKDKLSRQLLKKDVIFGNDVIKYRHAVNSYKPLTNGVMRENTKLGREALQALVEHLFQAVGLDASMNVHIGVGVPSRASFMHKDMLKEILSPYCSKIEMISEPLAVALSLDTLFNSIVVDIGSGTTDISRLTGALPNEKDEKTIIKAGDHITELLYQDLIREYPHSEVTLNYARQLKEKYSFVGDMDAVVEVDLVNKGKRISADISNSIKAACESIIPDIVEGIIELVMSFDLDLQPELRNNVVLAGGGSQIENIGNYLCDVLQAYGGVRVKTVKDPTFGVAAGTLRFVEELSEE